MPHSPRRLLYESASLGSPLSRRETACQCLTAPAMRSVVPGILRLAPYYYQGPLVVSALRVSLAEWQGGPSTAAPVVPANQLPRLLPTQPDVLGASFCTTTLNSRLSPASPGNCRRMSGRLGRQTSANTLTDIQAAMRYVICRENAPIRSLSLRSEQGPRLRDWSSAIAVRPPNHTGKPHPTWKLS